MRKSSSIAITRIERRDLMQVGLLAGLAGGLAEVLWISTFAAGSQVGAAAVARGVAGAVGLGGAGAVSIGVAVHMALAAALGVIVVAVLRALPIRRRGWRADLTLTLAALAAVWAFNFLVLLPVLSPEFVTIVPMPVSFASKLLFGLATFAAFEASEARANRQARR